MNKISSEQNLTPLQPELLKQSSYRETFVNWNTACIKSGAIFYEFETGKDAQLIRLIPDACPDFSFQITDHDVNAIVFGIQQDAIEVSLAPHSRYFGFKPLVVTDHFCNNHLGRNCSESVYRLTTCSRITPKYYFFFRTQNLMKNALR